MSYEKEYYENGNVKCEKYCKNNKLHRLNKPSYISYYENGNIRCEKYYQNGKRHRKNNKAFIFFIYKCFYFNSCYFTIYI